MQRLIMHPMHNFSHPKHAIYSKIPFNVENLGNLKNAKAATYFFLELPSDFDFSFLSRAAWTPYMSVPMVDTAPINANTFFVVIIWKKKTCDG